MYCINYGKNLILDYAMENYPDADLWTIFPNVKRVGVQVSGGSVCALLLYNLV